MPQFFFHLSNGISCHDEEGLILADEAAARQEAIRSARSILADEVLHGHLPLDDRIVVTDKAGKRVLVLPFRDAVDIP